MSKKASPAIIGIFTLAGLVLAAVSAIFFGAGKYFEKTYPVLMYFETSANGLKVGSDVRFGGVRIGRVRSINVLVDTDRNRKVIPVVVELAANSLGSIGASNGAGIDFSTREGIDNAVKDGLRAGMKQESLVTGQLYIEFDILPEAESFVYRPHETPEYPVVPTVGTQIDALIAGIADGLKKFNALDLDGVMTELRDLLSKSKDQIAALDMEKINKNLVAITDDIQRITGDEKLVRAVENLDRALIEIEDFAAKANKGIEPLLADLKETISKTDASLERIEKAAAEIQLAAAGVSDFSNPRAPMLLQLQDVLRETRRASQALEELSNDIKRNPGTLLRGRANP